MLTTEKPRNCKSVTHHIGILRKKYHNMSPVQISVYLCAFNSWRKLEDGDEGSSSNPACKGELP